MTQLMKVSTVYDPKGWQMIPTNKNGTYYITVYPCGAPTVVLHKVGKKWSATAMDTGYGLASGQPTKQAAIDTAAARYHAAAARGADFCHRMQELKAEHDMAVTKYFPQ